MSTRKDHCYLCGYTKDDAAFHMDHHLCKNDGNAPWQNESAPPQPVAAQEKKRPPIERECVKCAHQFKGSWQTPCPNCEVSPSPVATAGQETCGCHVNHGKVPCCPCKCHIVPPAATTQPEPKPAPQGSWPNPCTQRAFVDGMRWWQFHKLGSTAFPSEVEEAEKEAVRRYGEPKPTPQAEGFEEWFTDERADKYQYGAEGAARDVWSAAQAPLLARLEKAEARIAELENRGTASLYVPKAQYEAMKARLEARIAELESAQPKAEKVEKLVRGDWIKAMVGNMDEDEPTSQALRELLQRRQREERRGE